MFYYIQYVSVLLFFSLFPITLIFSIASGVMAILFSVFQQLGIYNHLYIFLTQMMTVYTGILCPCIENAWSGFTYAAQFIRVEFKAISHYASIADF